MWLVKGKTFDVERGARGTWRRCDSGDRVPITRILHPHWIGCFAWYREHEEFDSDCDPDTDSDTNSDISSAPTLAVLFLSLFRGDSRGLLSSWLKSMPFAFAFLRKSATFCAEARSADSAEALLPRRSRGSSLLRSCAKVCLSLLRSYAKAQPSARRAVGPTAQKKGGAQRRQRRSASSAAKPRFFTFAALRKSMPLAFAFLRKSATFCAEGRRPDSAEERRPDSAEERRSPGFNPWTVFPPRARTQ